MAIEGRLFCLGIEAGCGSLAGSTLILLLCPLGGALRVHASLPRLSPSPRRCTRPKQGTFEPLAKAGTAFGFTLTRRPASSVASCQGAGSESTAQLWGSLGCSETLQDVGTLLATSTQLRPPPPGRSLLAAFLLSCSRKWHLCSLLVVSATALHVIE